MTHDRTRIERRAFLSALGLGGIAAVSGCLGDDDNSDDTNGGSSDSTGDSDDDSDGDMANQSGGQLQVGVSRNPDTFNPIMHVNGAAFQATGWMYSNLTKTDENLTVHPDLATDWEANSDASAWTFNLREDATFHHNGEQVTAEDVKATLDTIEDEDVGSPGAGTLGPIESVEAVDDTTVQINLDGNDPDTPKKMAKQHARIIPADVIENRFDELGSNDFGSGPFTLEEFETGSHIRTSRYEDYYMTDEDGNELPHLDGVTQTVYPEATAEITAMGNDQVDIMWEVPVSQYGKVQSQEGTEALRNPSGAFANLVMRSDQPPFEDNRVRKAFKYAVDKEVMLEGAQDGLGTVAQDHPISAAHEFHAELPQRDHDPERAKELLEEAGYGDGLELTLMVADEPPVRVDYAVLLQEQLAEIGVDIEIERISYDRYLSDVWTQAPFYMGYYGLRFTEDGILHLLLHSEGAWNESHWSDDEFDQVIEDARRTTDADERAELYARAQEILQERGPYLISFFQDQLAAQREYVENYELDPTGFFVPVEDVSLGEGAPDR